jgi:hypothetical protein
MVEAVPIHEWRSLREVIIPVTHVSIQITLEFAAPGYHGIREASAPSETRPASARITCQRNSNLLIHDTMAEHDPCAMEMTESGTQTDASLLPESGSESIAFSTEQVSCELDESTLQKQKLPEEKISTVLGIMIGSIEQRENATMSIPLKTEAFSNETGEGE